jgi:signal transduction histidine kinase
VEVELVSDDGFARMRVIDTGVGIPLKAQARVFERFYRVDEARSRDRGGTGLGLAIVKHVADLYGGRVELQSEYGEGSTFTAYLPLATQPLDLSEGA